MTEKVKEYYKAIQRQVIRPHARWNQFLELFTVSDSQMVLLSTTAPGFFGIVRDVIRDDAFITLSRPTDNATTSGQENLTLVALVEIIEAEVGGGLAQTTRTLLNDLLAKVSGIRLWRNKVIAHIDLQRALQYDPEPLTKVQRGDIDEAFRLIRQILNEVAAGLGEPETFYEGVVVAGDARSLVQALQ
jgi:hypothetical protein